MLLFSHKNIHCTFIETFVIYKNLDNLIYTDLYIVTTYFYHTGS